MNILCVSHLFPNPLEPTRGMFNAEQFRALSAHARVKVIAPTHAAMPAELRDGIEVLHPRFFHLPMITRPLNGWLMARAIEPALLRERFDAVFVTFAYPDAFAVMLLARKYGFPFVTSVLGSDVNELFKNWYRKRQVLRALRASSHVFAVSQALCARVRREGIAASTLYDGVDRTAFYARDRGEACRSLGLSENRRRILFVGNLVPIKGPRFLAAAFDELADLEDVDLVFVGEGPEAKRIRANARIAFIGSRPHAEIPLWLNASDVLCLPSLNEGTPNVVLEALACGKPVVASRVGGVPELVKSDENGVLVSPGDARALATALRTALATTWSRSRILDSAAHFDWHENAGTVVRALSEAIGAR